MRSPTDVSCGVWQEVGRRVYRGSPAAALTYAQRVLAAALKVGGVASHSRAGVLLGLLPAASTVEITVPRSKRSAWNRHAHSTTTLAAIDVTTVDGIPCTAPARTLVDLGGSMTRERFEDVLDVAHVRRLVSPRRLAERAVELWSPRRAGCAAVLALLEARSPEALRARNLGEARVLRVFREHGLSEPSCNHPVVVAGQRRVLDFAWPAHRVAAEFDGFDTHARRHVFDDDGSRQNDLVDAGWRVFRLTASAHGSLDVALRPIVNALSADW